MPRAPRTIGQVLDLIRPEFPDISVSKVRYLESEGLVSPDRDHPSGYRRFSQDDVDRLLFVLRTQRDKYLPLKVIREHLEAMDRGEDVGDIGEAKPEESAGTQQPAKPRRPTTRLLTRRQLLHESQLPEATLIELERARIIAVRPGTQLYGQEAVAIAVAAKNLAHYGIDPRQLRVIQQAAISEAALVEQALSPLARRPGAPKEATADVYRYVIQAHAAMLHGQIVR